MGIFCIITAKLETKSPYIKQLTFLRFVAAILVVIFHFGQHVRPFESPLVSTFFGEGSIAVSFFFFLSGSVLAINYLNSTNFIRRLFWKKRIARIYPVYLLTFAMALIFGMMYHDAFPKGDTVVLHLLGIQAWVPGKTIDINFPGWSISVELFFYFLFPWIILLFQKLSTKKLITLVLTIWCISFIQHLYFTKYLWRPNNRMLDQLIVYFPVWHLNTFVFGVLGGMTILKLHDTHTYPKWFPRIMYTVGILSYFFLLNSDHILRWKTHNGLLSPLFFMIIVGLALDRSWFTKILSLKPMMTLGNASYSLYLLQWPIFILFSASLGSDKLDQTSFYFYLILLIGLSLISYFFFEKPIRKKWLEIKSAAKGKS